MSTRLKASPSGWRSKDDWRPDVEAVVCFGCTASFTVRLRRHHCRLCGEVFCAKCVAKTTRNLAGGFSATAVPACGSCCAKVRAAPLDPASVQPFYSLEYAPASCTSDRAFVHTVVARDTSGTELKFAADALRADEQLVLDAVAQSAAAFRHASAELRADRQFALAAAIRNADALQFTPECLRDDRDFILAAAHRNGAVLQYASAALKDDEAIVVAALSNDPHTLVFSSARLQGAEKVALLAVRQDPTALVHLPPALSRDRGIVLAAVKAAALQSQPANIDARRMLANALRALPPADETVPEPPLCTHAALGELAMIAVAKPPLPPRVDTATAYSGVLTACAKLEER